MSTKNNNFFINDNKWHEINQHTLLYKPTHPTSPKTHNNPKHKTPKEKKNVFNFNTFNQNNLRCNHLCLVHNFSSNFNGA